MGHKFVATLAKGIKSRPLTLLSSVLQPMAGSSHLPMSGSLPSAQKHANPNALELGLWKKP